MALTKVSGDILDTGIVVAGIVTATEFVGAGLSISGISTFVGVATFKDNAYVDKELYVGGIKINTGGGTVAIGTDIVTRNIKATGLSTFVGDAQFDGNVSIAGTLTYQDVTNVDSTGIATARVGLDILSGGLNIVGLTTGLHVSGIITATNAIVISEDNAIHFRGIATDDNDAILRASAGGGQLLINSRNDTILNIDSNDDSTDAHFAIAHGAATGSSTELFRVQENGEITQTAASGNTVITLKRSNTNTTGLVGGINFAALDGHSVASIQARGDGNDDGAHLQFYTTSAAAGDIFNAANIERLRIKSDGIVNIGDRVDNTWIDSTLKVRKDQNAVTKIAVRNEDQGSSASAAIVVNSYGNSWMFDCGSAAKNSNALTIRVDATANSNQGTEKLRITTGGNIKAPDGAKIELGGAQTGAGDLQLHHTSNVSWIDNTYAGSLTIKSGGEIRFRTNSFTVKDNANSDTIIHAADGAGVDLYCAGGRRLHTTDYGATVTGEIVTNQNYPNFRPRVDWNFAAVKKLDPRIKYRRQYNASYTDEFGIIRQVAENEPRFDHDPITGECKGLLLEDGRSNLVASSEEMNENFGSWVNNGIGARYTDTSGVISPDGTTGSTKLIENGATSSHLIYDNVSCSASTGYITSVFLKKPATNGRTFALITEGNTQPATAYFNLVTGTATGSGTGYVSSGTIEYPNGWWRCWMRFNTGSSQSSLNVQFGPAGDSGTGSFSYAGDSNKYILAWGAQCESGEMVTSYIKTERHANDNGSTRGQDFTTVEGSDFSDIFDTDFKQFSMVADYDNTTTPDGNAYSIIDLWGEETNYEDRIEWFKDNASPYHIETRSFGGNSSIFANGNLSASSKAKAQRIASSWYVPDYSNTTSRRFVVSMGGEAVDVVSDGSGTSVPSLTRLGIGCNPTRLDFGAGVLHFKRLMFYNRTLSDIQLQNLSAQ